MISGNFAFVCLLWDDLANFLRRPPESMQNISERAMLVSNQRPLPCESEACSFAIVRCYPIPAFLSRLSRHVYRGRSSTFAQLSSNCRQSIACLSF
jgi:hypothetical protein